MNTFGTWISSPAVNWPRIQRLRSLGLTWNCSPRASSALLNRAPSIWIALPYPSEPPRMARRHRLRSCGTEPLPERIGIEGPQVASSSLPVAGSDRDSWKPDSAMKLARVPVDFTWEKFARSNRICARRIAASGDALPRRIVYRCSVHELGLGCPALVLRLRARASVSRAHRIDNSKKMPQRRFIRIAPTN